jgi:hypothetical protein
MLEIDLRYRLQTPDLGLRRPKSEPRRPAGAKPGGQRETPIFRFVKNSVHLKSGGRRIYESLIRARKEIQIAP